MRRAARHKVGSRGADLGAVEHEANMLWLSMCAAHFQAMRRCHLKAGYVASLARVDAALHFG